MKHTGPFGLKEWKICESEQGWKKLNIWIKVKFKGVRPVIIFETFISNACKYNLIKRYLKILWEN